MTRVAITGAGGFIGRHLCAAAREAGMEVQAVSRKALRESGGARHLTGATALVHLAGRAHGGPRATADVDGAYSEANVGLTRTVARACVTAGVPRLIFMSSAGVLGYASPDGGLRDDSPPAPHDAYTRSKLEAERVLLEDFADRVETVILRPPVVYGPGAPGSFGRLLRLADTPWPLPLGGVKAPRSYISVRNLCDLLLSAVASSLPAGLRLLVADAETPSLSELIRLLRREMGRPSRLVRLPVPLLGALAGVVGRGPDVRALRYPFVVHATGAKEAFGWSPARRLEDELRWTVRAVRSARATP